MATGTEKAYRVTTLDAIEPRAPIEPGAPADERELLDVRRHLGIRAFGINGYRSAGEGEVIREHDETGVGATEQEELYIVLRGRATFNVDGEQIDAPAGSFVFVRDPAAKRSAVAKEDGTTILAIGGTPGKAYDPAPVEGIEALEAYNAGDYETALAKQRVLLEQRPNDVLALFNTACFEARLGRADDALEHLQLAIQADDRILEYVRSDEDLDSLREDPRFKNLIQ